MGDIQQDPSMEEILASIKRVIAEDGRAAAASTRPQRRPARVEPPSFEPEEAEDVLELDDPVGEAGGLLSADAAAASRQKLAALSALSERSEGSSGAGDGALETVVRDMLRPLLKDWLDQHLPELVEQLVTREIARITGRSL
jgi:hypothetical protein